MVLRYKSGFLVLSAPFVERFLTVLITEISRKSFLNTAGLAREMAGFTLSGLSSNVLSVALEASRFSRGEAYFNYSWSALITGFVL